MSSVSCNAKPLYRMCATVKTSLVPFTRTLSPGKTLPSKRGRLSTWSSNSSRTQKRDAFEA